MLLDLGSILDSCAAALGTLPFWLLAVYGVLWLAPPGVLLLRSRGTLLSEEAGRCTMHSAFWLAVMLAVPCWGALVYLIGSLVPYLVWRRRHAEEPFPYACRMQRNQLAALLLTAVFFTVLSAVGAAQQWSFITDRHWLFEGSFLCVTVLIVTDYFLNVFGCALYLWFPARDREIEERSLLFGVPYARERGAYVRTAGELREDARIARAAADAVFRQPYADTLRGETGRVRLDGETYIYIVYGTQRQWRQTAPDAVDCRYLGLGITRCRICQVQAQGGREQFTETVVYRAVPRLGGWAARSLTLLAVQTALCTPWALAVHQWNLSLMGV